MKKLIALIVMAVLSVTNSAYDYCNKTTVNIASKQSDTVTITFTGDCTLGGYKGQGTSGNYNEYFDNYGADYFFDSVRDIFKSDDLTFINLEGPITSRQTTVNKQFPISCRPEHIDILTNSSIEVCSLANNHTLDCGVDGLNDTISTLADNNIGFCYNENISIHNIDGIKVACLAYNGWNTDKELMTNIENNIKSCKNSGVSIVCIMFHWGNERENYSNSVQETLAHHAVDCGADIVIGNHPHVMQGIEKYNGKTILYSLGNFTFGANKNPKDKDTFIFQQEFIVNVEGAIEYGNETIIPCSISSSKDKNTYQPTPLVEDDATRVMNRLIKYSSKYKETLEMLEEK